MPVLVLPQGLGIKLLMEAYLLCLILAQLPLAIVNLGRPFPSILTSGAGLSQALNAISLVFILFIGKVISL
jgi:hypothetical protein